MIPLKGAGISLNGLFFRSQWLLLAVAAILGTWIGLPSILFVTHEQFVRLAPVAPFGIFALLLIPRWGMRGFLAAMAVGAAVLVAIPSLIAGIRNLRAFWTA